MRKLIRSIPVLPYYMTICMALVVVIGYLDSMTPVELTLDILYLIPISIAAWNAGKWPGVAVACAAAATWCVSQHLSGYRQNFPTIFWWNAFMLQVFFLLTSILISKLRTFQKKLISQKTDLEAALLQLHEANDKLHQLDLQKDEFLAVCSHDIRGPLCGSIAGAQILLKQVHGPLNPKQLVIVERNLKIAREVLKLTSELLDLARIDAGKEALNIERFNLAHVIAESVDSHGGWDTNRPVNFEIHPESGDFEIAADRLKVLRICNNLISNAVKYSPANGVVKIVIHRLSGEIEFAVSDTGPGIPKENLEKLFDRFSSLARTKKTRDEGTGLGLSISCELVKLHGGKINVGSEVGCGTTFYVTLPLVAKPRATNARPSAFFLPHGTKPITAPMLEAAV